MFNPSKSFENRLDEEIMFSEIYRHAKKINEEQASEPDAIRIEDFTKYDKKIIEKDIALVEKNKSSFENQPEERKKLSRIAFVFETLINEQIEQSDWLGPNAFTIKSSPYDDIVNGIDSIVEFQEEESFSHLALGIDETFSLDVDKKFQRIKDEINRGELANIKYFYSERMNFRGELLKIPRVVIGADVRTVKELGELWIEKEKKKLGNHPIQFLIIEEMMLQLKNFEDYAIKVGQLEIAKIYNRSWKILKGIADEKMGQKKSVADELEKMEYTDKVFQAIKDSLTIFQL